MGKEGRPSAKIWVKTKDIVVITAKIYPKPDGRAVIRLPPGFLTKVGQRVTIIIIDREFENEEKYYEIYEKLKEVIEG